MSSLFNVMFRYWLGAGSKEDEISPRNTTDYAEILSTSSCFLEHSCWCFLGLPLLTPAELQYKNTEK